MPPSKPLPSAILSALGLATTGCGLLGPCLDYTVCLDYVTYPSGTTGDTATTDSGTVGPCLDYVTTTGDTGSTSVRAPLPPHVPDKDAILESLTSEGALPEDVLRRLGGEPDRN